MKAGGFFRAVGAVALAAFLALAGRTAEPAPWRQPRTPAEQKAYNRAVFDQVWILLDQRHFESASRRTAWRSVLERHRPLALEAPDTMGLYYEVLAPMLNALGESHVGASPPAGRERITWQGGTSGSIQTPRIFIAPKNLSDGEALHGVGVSLAKGEVIDLIKGGAAERAGVEIGWRVDLITPSTRRSERRYHFRTASGEFRTLILDHSRPPPPRMPYEGRRLPSGALLLRFDAFEKSQIDWVLAELKNAPPEGVILDLRKNGGGQVVEEERLLGALLPDRSRIGTRIANGRGTILFTRSGLDAAYNGPLALLISPRSASAAEVTASALRHHGRAVLVGRGSAGAVLTSLYFRLPDGGRLQVPVYDLYDPAGRRIEGAGVEPDVHAAPTLALIRAGRDPVLEAADAALAARRR